MSALRLQFPNREHDDLVLGPGVSAIGRSDGGAPVFVDDPERMLVQFCIDRRGVWLQVRDGVRGIHVNGRPVRHMAILRAGDAIHIDGYRLCLCGPQPALPPALASGDAPPSGTSLILRGIGGPYHGRSIVLDQPRLVGASRASDIRIDEAGFTERHARLEPHPDGLVLRDLGSEQGSWVNGWPVRHALVRPGSQLMFDAQHRFVVEAPTVPPLSALTDPLRDLEVRGPGNAVVQAPAGGGTLRRVPWLLLAALLLAGALSLLLLYGAR